MTPQRTMRPSIAVYIAMYIDYSPTILSFYGNCHCSVSALLFLPFDFIGKVALLHVFLFGILNDSDIRWVTDMALASA